MNTTPEKQPVLMRRVPFFLICALCGPLALCLLLIYWRDVPEERGPMLFFAAIFTSFFIVKLLPDGLFQIILFALTYTIVLFVTYQILGRKRERNK